MRSIPQAYLTSVVLESPGALRTFFIRIYADESKIKVHRKSEHVLHVQMTKTEVL